MGNNLQVTYGFVGNPGFVGISIFQNSTWHPKYDESNVILQHSSLKWKFYNAVHALNANSAVSNPMDLWVTRKFVENG